MKKWGTKEEFKKYAVDLAEKLEVEIGVISFRKMKNKWASYTKKTRLLIFNADLLTMDKKLGEYVILHELLHFRVPNHGRLWKTYMNSFMPGWEKQDKDLKTLGR